jgi:hypothetical protein
MTKDKIMQAVGRLRKFGRNQKLKIFLSEDILYQINGLNETKNVSQKTKLIL